MNDRADNQAAEWLQPAEEQGGLQSYVETIRERLWLIVLTTVITTAIALIYVITATKMYEAQANLLITPVSSADPTLATLGLITDSSDPTRPVETAAKFVTNIDVAKRVKKVLGSDETPQALLSMVSAEPIAQSNVVAVTSNADSPRFAKQLADTFSEQAVADRTKRLHERVDATVPLLAQQISKDPTQATGVGSLGAELALLQTLGKATDPTIAVDSLADVPSGQVSPRPLLSIAGGIFAGLILGIGAAFAAQALDPRLRREQQLRRRYRLPILTRIPRDTSGRSDAKPLSPRAVAPSTAEAYRTLRATLVTRNSSSGGGRVILVTGSSVSEGKTTTAVNLAASLALSGQRVILIESDLRRPSLGKALGVTPENGGVVSTLIENTELSDALVTSADYGPNLQMLLADYEGGWIAELFSIPAAEAMIEQARTLADFVVIDSAPLTEVVDALPLARHADDVVIVVRIGQTRIDRVSQLAELLAESGIKPVGFAIVGAPRAGGQDYHYYAGVSGPGAGGPDQRQPRKLFGVR
jgi:capsular exopolysaccharide synthesis family protein